MKTRYEAIYRQLRDSILSGARPLGSRLPSKRTIAREAGVSLVTVEHALLMLVDEGYVEARERSGYFAVYRETDGSSVPRQVKLRKHTPDHHHVVGEFPFASAARKLRATIMRYGERLLVKSPNFGTSELRDAIAAYLVRSRGLDVKSSQIVIGSGSEYLYGLLAQLFRGKSIAIEDPSYQKIRQVYEAHGIDCELLRLGPNGITSAALAKAKSKLLHVTPFRSYPTGVTADASKRREYVRFIEARDGILIEDDFESEFSPSRRGAETLYSISKSKRVIYINSFTRTMAPSMRIAYMVLPKSMLADFTKRVGFYSCTVPVLDQLFLADFIEEGDFERHLNRMRKRV